MEESKFAFRKGWLQVRNRDLPECRRKLMAATGQTTRAGFSARVWGKVEPKVSEAKAVEDVFHEYGITDIWGTE